MSRKLTIEEIVDRGIITDASIIQKLSKDPSLLYTDEVKEYVTQQADYLAIYGVNDDECEDDFVEQAIEESKEQEAQDIIDTVMDDEHVNVINENPEVIIEEPLEDSAVETVEVETKDEDDMKQLYDVVQEEAATPGNTMGMGNLVADDGTGKGSEPLPTAKASKPKKTTKKKKSEEE